MQIQGPPVSITHRKAFTLPVGELHPVIRIAHTQPWPVRVQPRIIYDYELVLILRGRARVTVQGRVEEVAGGDVLWFRPFEVHSIVSSDAEPFGHTAVHFDLAEGFPPSKRSLHNREAYGVSLGDGLEMPRRVRLETGGRTFGRFARIVQEWDKGTALGRLAARVELEKTILELISHEDEDAVAGEESTASVGVVVDSGVNGALSARDRARLKRVIQVMQSSLRASVTVRDLAEEAQMSASHFNRLFKRFTGYSPADYLRALRVQKARELLADPGLSIKEVAGLSGFGDPFVFSKTFRRVDGLTPSAYREALLAGRPASLEREKD